MTRSSTKRRIAGKLGRQVGFNLLELTVSLAIISSLGAFFVNSNYVLFRTANVTNARADLATEITKSTRWLIRDVHRALTSDLVDSAPATNIADFTWNISGVPNTCSYDLNTGTNQLRRTCPGDTFAAANGISNLQFVRSGDLITVSYTVTSTVDPSFSEDIEMNMALGGG